MGEDLGIPEIVRTLQRIERLIEGMVTKAVYDLEVKEIREDIKEIKDGQKWLTRSTIGLFFGLIAAVVQRAIT